MVLIGCDHMKTIDAVRRNEFVIEIPVRGHMKAHIGQHNEILQQRKERVNCNEPHNRINMMKIIRERPSAMAMSYRMVRSNYCVVRRSKWPM